jgi:hypothetical protein
MNIRTAASGGILGALVLAVLGAAPVAHHAQACPGLDAGWVALNWLQAGQLLRLLAALMTLC